MRIRVMMLEGVRANRAMTVDIPNSAYADGGKAERQERGDQPVVHGTAHPLAGKTVVLRLTREDANIRTGDLYNVEDWWDRVFADAWIASHERAVAKYSARADAAGLPVDDELVYGRVGGVGYIFHITELGPEVPYAPSARPFIPKRQPGLR